VADVHVARALSRLTRLLRLMGPFARASATAFVKVLVAPRRADPVVWPSQLFIVVHILDITCARFVGTFSSSEASQLKIGLLVIRVRFSCLLPVYIGRTVHSTSVPLHVAFLESSFMQGRLHQAG